MSETEKEQFELDPANLNDIYIMDAGGNNVRRLTTTLGYDGGPFFSPDGKQIVYRAWHPAPAHDSADYRGLIAQNLVRRLQPRVMIILDRDWKLVTPQRILDLVKDPPANADEPYRIRRTLPKDKLPIDPSEFFR